MKFIIFDTETTGLPKTKIMCGKTLLQWPHIVQFSYIIYDTDCNAIVKIYDKIIKIPDDVEISEESTNIHGITKAMTSASSTVIGDTIDEFMSDFGAVDRVVAHNIEFDLNVTKVAMLRVSDETTGLLRSRFNEYIVTLILTQKLFCTMKHTIIICNIQITTKYGK